MLVKKYQTDQQADIINIEFATPDASAKITRHSILYNVLSKTKNYKNTLDKLI